MKRPSKVKVLGKVYAVELDHNILEDESGSGVCKPWRCSIRISSELDVQQERDTLLHEVFHALFSETGLTGDFPLDGDEEKIVRRMATSCLALLRENPSLVKYLTA